MHKRQTQGKINAQNVHVLYKNLGETPNECILRFKKDNQEYAESPMTYAGRLDPMAEGLLLVLSGEELKNKDEYLGLQKTYEFEILWGFQTDTLDVLGLVESKKSKVESVEEKEIQQYLKNSIRKFEQNYPAYSSKPVSGKSLFEWAREGKLGEIEIPLHVVEIFESEHLSRKTISGKELLQNICQKVSVVHGDFRQEEILENWMKLLAEKEEDTFTVDRISATVSSGFYIRQFVFDLAKSLDNFATTFHINRTKIGNFSVENSH